MQLTQAGTGDMRIDLGSREICVTEQQLNHAKICAMIQHVGRKRVTQLVRRNSRSDASQNRILANSVPDRLPSQTVTARTEKHMCVRRRTHPVPTRPTNPGIQAGLGLFPERRETVLAAFAGDTQQPLGKLQSRQFQRGQFADSKSSRIQHFKHGSISAADGAACVRCTQQRLNLGFAQHSRKPTGPTRRYEIGERVAVKLTRTAQPGGETA